MRLKTSIRSRTPTLRGVWCLPSARVIALLSAVMVEFAAYRSGAEETHEQPLQELFQTDLVYPQEKGEVQLTFAPTFRRERDGSVWEIPISMEYGLTDAWQVEVEWFAFLQRRPSTGGTIRGIGDLEIGTQYSFLNIGGSLFHIAPRFSVRFPVGDIDKELTEGFIEYEPSVVLARDFPTLHNTQLFTQVGVGLVQRVKDPADPDQREPAAHELTWNTGFFIPFSRWVASVEINWTNNRWNNHGEEDQLYMTPGCIWKLGKSMEIGVGVPIGLNGHSDRFRIITNLICEF
jgi:hypothetical protein